VLSAAAADDTNAAAGTLLHSQQSWRASENAASLPTDPTQPQHQKPQQEQQEQQQDQQQVMMQTISQAPEQQLLRFASQAAAGTDPARTGRFSWQHSSSTAAPAAALGPIIRISAAAAAEPSSSLTAPAEAAAGAGEGVQDETGAVCFPRLLPAQPAINSSSSSQDGTQQQQPQQVLLLLQECSRGSLIRSAAEVGQQEGPDAAAHAEAAGSSTSDTADGVCSASAVATDAALAQQDAAVPAPQNDNLVLRPSKVLRHALWQQASEKDSSRQPLAQEHARPIKGTSQQQQQQQQEQAQQQQPQQQHDQPQGAAGPGATPASGTAGAPAPDSGVLSNPGVARPVQLPPELGSAVQRALKVLTDPTPPRPLAAPDLNPAAVLAQQRRLEEADRCVTPAQHMHCYSFCGCC
jgi:hypothetical protein